MGNKLNLKEIKTKSNLLSLFRLLLAAPIFYLFTQYSVNSSVKYYLVALYLVAGITDTLDGYLARKFNEVTELGKIIDPLADKTLVVVIVIMLFYNGMLPKFYFWTIVGRDVLIFIGGIFVTKKIKKVLPSNFIGKFTVLNIGIFLILATLNFNNNFFYNFFYYISLFLSYVSLLAYLLRGIEAIKWSKNELV